MLMQIRFAILCGAADLALPVNLPQRFFTLAWLELALPGQIDVASLQGTLIHKTVNRTPGNGKLVVQDDSNVVD